MIQSIFAGVLAVVGVISGFFWGQHHEEPLPIGADAVTPIAGQTYALAGTGISSTATSFTLTSFTIPQNGKAIQDSEMSETFYVTFEPGSRQRQEIASCTTVVQNGDGSATISGCTRGLSPVTPYTASSTLQFSHSGGTAVIFSDPPQLFNQAAFKANDETITGQWTFENFPITPSSTPATGTTTGTVELATGAEAASSTLSGDIAVSKLALHTGIATSAAPVSGNVVLVTGDDGNIDSNFLAGDAYPVRQITATSTFTSVQAAYVTSAGFAAISSAQSTTTNGFDGFITTNGATSSTVTLQTAGIVSGLSGLTPGSAYYLSNTSGAISTTGGSTTVLVGTAISASEILIQKDTPTCIGTGTTGTNAGTLAVTCGFFPKKVRIYAVNGGSGFASAMDATFSNGVTAAGSFAYNEGTAGLSSNLARIYDTEANADYMEFSVGSYTATGFTISWAETGTFGDSSPFYFDAE